MKHSPNPTAPHKLRLRTSLSLTTATLLAAASLSACSSHCNKSTRISSIVDQQLVVIESLKRERESLQVSGIAQKDETLRRAEVHLATALVALERSIQEIKQEEEK